ncbi:LPLT family lysophospholipid transporter-like MFS transporter [Thiogranum longum]|uniref:LPLT family lysophospholipid transporter-like MFS transporter n=1 Tax=Thiogranum longum TaxID=1537524 RepID=A0A4R1H5D5_9GAMM|nr:lysophospholipid transporter LplT [Thiogranum longum]TCK16927.1 LPLT family lysophospholipid transporter-like MFS transporter [Thiogranum longum]
MTRGLFALLVAQFLSAFADNAILFTLVAMVLQADNIGDWYIPALQGSFLLAFVLLAPWVGPLADRYPKPQVLIAGNLVKLAGVLLLLAGIEPLFAYALVGLGAALYSPAKYGILPEMVETDALVRANAWIEATTIAAIVLGTVAGAAIADRSLVRAFWLIAGLYGFSLVATLLIPPLAARGATLQHALPEFFRLNRIFWRDVRARFALLGGGLFWGSAALLRVALVAWAPLVLVTRSASDIADLTLFLAIGVILGSASAPRLVPLSRLARVRYIALLMGLLIAAFSTVDSVWPARIALLVIGMTGGLFVVPVNAAVQHEGHHSIGSGHAVAIQNFFQNLAMLLSVGLYTLLLALEISVIPVIAGLGVFVMTAAILLPARHLSRN